MKRNSIGVLLLVFGAAVSASAQSLDDLNIQFHGYATQGFLYTTNNNILTTNSSDGSPAWTEAVVNLSATPTPRLRVAVQGRYFLLGSLGNTISLDYAAADYKVDDRFGLRFGKVKTPSGLFNDVQDIDPAYPWALLPQGVYPITNRNGFLAHYGGVVYGTFKLGPKLGKLEYRGWGGERVLNQDDGYVLPFVESGIQLAGPISWIEYGAALRWRTPLPGLVLGVSEPRDNRLFIPNLTIAGTIPGTDLTRFPSAPDYFGQYQKGRWMAAAEGSRFAPHNYLNFTGIPELVVLHDYRTWYAMASCKATEKLTTGAYFSQRTDHQAPLGPARYQRDWTISGRYDFNQYLYAKAEQHFLRGTTVNYDADANPGGLKPNTKLTILKVGVSF